MERGGWRPDIWALEGLSAGQSRYAADLVHMQVLISPDQFDLSRPLTVRTNGEVSFEGHLSPDVETMLRWASRDQDRTMLFAAEIEIEVGDVPRQRETTVYWMVLGLSGLVWSLWALRRSRVRGGGKRGLL